MRLRTTMALLALALLPASAAPQQSSLLTLGIRVRLSALDTVPALFASRDRIIGTLTAAGRDSLSILDLDRGRIVTVPLAELSRVEISQGRHSRAGKGAVIGLLAGAAAGVASGLVLCGIEDCSSSGGDWGAAVVLVLGTGGALAGTGLGAIVGALVRTERWREVAVPGPGAAAPAAPRRLGLSIRM